jgi:hypothetical protein
MRDFANPLQVVHGTLRDARATAFAIVKDEMFYLPSFLDHHRRLGVDQFIFLDDQSSDGTRELLVAQPDCLVLASPFRFGEAVAVPGQGGRRRERAGILFKSLIPQRFLAGRYALYLDGDEYLMLPPGVSSVGELFDLLARHDVRSVAANLIDFFPATVAEMQLPRELPTSEAMLGAYPYFDALPLLGTRFGQRWPAKLDKGTTARLFRQHHIRMVIGKWQSAPRWLTRWLLSRYPESNVLKTPVVRWDPGTEYLNSHRANVPVTDKVLLGLAHMKFTCDLSRRLQYAVASKSYARGSEKYQWYGELLERMRRGDGSFLGPHSARYRGPAGLAAAGLTRLELA